MFFDMAKTKFFIYITYLIDLLVYVIITIIRYYHIYQNITPTISKHFHIILITDFRKLRSDARTTCIKVLGARFCFGGQWLIQEGANVSFCTRRGQRDARGIVYQEGRAIQGFETPIRILSILKKYPTLVGLGEVNVDFLHQKWGQGDARGISYKEVGAIQGFETPIRILGI